MITLNCYITNGSTLISKVIYFRQGIVNVIGYCY